jgi:protein SCO1/2
MRKHSGQYQNLFLIIAALVALLVGITFYTHFTQPSESSTIQPSKVTDYAGQYGTEYIQWYPQPRQLVEFELVTSAQKTMTNQAIENQWTLAFVGYTFCPDICPTTLAALNRAYADIAAIDTEFPVKVWFLSVDPKRDTPERLADYVQFFNPAFIAATGEHKQLYPLVRSMGMMYAMAGDTSQPNYLVDHSGSIVLINPKGEVVGRFKPKGVPGQIAISDTEQILADLPKIVGS